MNTSEPGREESALFYRSLDRNRFVCLPLADADVEEAARLYTEVFIADEPTTHRHAPDPALFLPFARHYIGNLPGKGCSYLVKEKNTQRTVAFLFGFDLMDDFWMKGEKMTAFLNHFREAVIMIEELEEPFIRECNPLPGSILHIFQVGVDRRFRGKGIAKAMISQIIIRAREMGFEKIVADCTNQGSMNVFEQCGFSVAAFSSYDSFSTNNVRFFEGISGGISLMVRDLR